MRTYLILLLFISFLRSFGQKGEFYITEYLHSNENRENQNAAITQDGNGRMVFANANGVLLFDGRTWETVTTPSSALSLEKDDKSGIIYVGCLNDFGYLENKPNGEIKYIQVYHAPDQVLYASKIVLLKEKIYLLVKTGVVEIEKLSKKILRNIPLDNRYNCGLIFSNGSELYLSDKEKGILKLTAKGFEKINTSLPPDEKVVFTSFIRDGYLLAGTDKKNIYSFNNNTFNRIKLDDQTFLNKAGIADGIVINLNRAVITTEKAGCIIINYVTGKTVDIINQFTGLPDYEIFAIGKDNQSGIWLAHEKGLSRVDLSLPFTDYSRYPGLQGEINAVCKADGKVYIGTGEGVFCLTEVTDPEGINFYASKFKPKTRTSFKSKISNFLDFPTKAPDLVTTETGVALSTQDIQVDQLSSNAGLAFKSLKYVYQKLTEVEGNCRFLIPFEEKLIAATNLGLFEINRQKAKRIMGGDITFAHVNKYTRELIVAEQENRVIKYSNLNGEWIKMETMDFSDKVISINSQRNRICLNFKDKIFLFDGSLNEPVKSLKIDNPYADELKVISADEDLKIFLTSGIYTYNTRSGILSSDSSFKKLRGLKFIQTQPDVVWINNGNTWSYYDRKINSNNFFAYFKIFKDVDNIFLSSDKSECWLTTRSGGIYYFNLYDGNATKTPAPVFLKEVLYNKGKPIDLSSIDIYQNSGHVSFNFMIPEFLDNSSILFQYKVEGLNHEWSPWTRENTITFDYLPGGNYALKVRARNALNQVVESKPVNFTIKPPYWQQWWFYMIELVFFGSLLVVSIIVNRSNHQYIWLSKGLTYLTIVMMIEFVNTIGESYLEIKDSPVESFLLQVFLALLILPFEQVLLKFLKGNSGRFFKRINFKVNKNTGLAEINKTESEIS